LTRIDNAQMQDFQFVSFFLGHDAGDRARRLLAECELLDVALSSRANRHAWSGDVHFGVSLRLPVEDRRLTALLERLRAAGKEPFTRLDREYSPEELDSADWLIMRVATAGLYGGVDYGQSYRFENACGTCGAGAELVLHWSPNWARWVRRMGLIRFGGRVSYAA
jgi:hypothetical protein